MPQLNERVLHSEVDQIANAKVVDVGGVSVEEAGRLIDEHVSKHPGVHHVSELAEVLGIELGIAFPVVQKLIQETKVKVRR